MITAAKLSIIGRRLLQTVPVIVLSTFIVFGLLKLVPGDVAVTLAGDNASEQRITEIREISVLRAIRQVAVEGRAR